MKINILSITVLLILVWCSSCEQPETPVVLPKAFGKKYSYQMGNDYSSQIYVDLEHGLVSSAKVTDWDLSFSCDPNSRSIYLNGGGAGVLVATIAKGDFINDFNAKNLKWNWDAANGLSDSLALKNWHTGGVSNDSVYVIDRGNSYQINDRYFQFKLLACTKDTFMLQTANRYGQNVTTHFIPKTPSKLLNYFTFGNGGKILDFEPIINNWDICFLNYRTVYYEFSPPLLYSVVGSFINTKKIEVALDSSSLVSFENVSISDFNPTKRFSNLRDVIGFDWKVPMFGGTGVTYRTRSYVTYLIRKKNMPGPDLLFKLRFIDFYDMGGNKGAPTYEIVRMQ